MEAWIGPAIVAAMVSAIVSVLGWIVTFRMSLRMEQLRRQEKVHDFQVALRAEIASDLLNMVVADRRAFLEEVTERYRADASYFPIVPTQSKNVVFDAIVGQIHVLPGTVITPVIHYARMRQRIEKFIDDLRAPLFRELGAERQLMMYSDYLDMLDRVEQLGRDAAAALDDSLNSSDGAQSIPKSASAGDGASAERKASP